MLNAAQFKVVADEAGVVYCGVCLRTLAANQIHSLIRRPKTDDFSAHCRGCIKTIMSAAIVELNRRLMETESY